MKRLFSFVASMLLGVTLFADNEPTYIFTKDNVDENGIYRITYSFPTEMSADILYSTLKTWILGLDVQERTINMDRKNEEINATVAFNTKISYNPFAGTFSDFLYVNIQLLIKEGVVECNMDNFQVVSVYSGYGQKRNARTVSQMLDEIEASLVKMNDKSYSKKERGNAEDLYEDNVESLNKASEEYKSRIESKLKALKF